jgi:di/tricarboxylate transporter
MDLGVLSLVLLLAAIVLGFFRKTNVGLVSLLFALVLGRIAGMNDASILKGFNPNLFIKLMGVTFLFSVLNVNGTIDLLARKIVALAGKNNVLIPILIYLMGLGLTMCGPGSIPVLAIMPAFAIPIARAHGYNPLMLSIIGCCGCFSGRMTTITPEGILTYELLGKAGIDTAAAVRPVFTNLFISGLLLAILCFVYYKGWRVEKRKEIKEEEHLKTFTAQQWLSLLGLLAMAVLVIAFKFNIGLVAFAIAAVLLLCHCANEGKSFKGVPWGVLIMVSGVSTLMNIVIKTGGIKLLTAALSTMMTPFTGAAVMGATAGIMSLFSSGLGVVFPTLLPTVASVSEAVGDINPIVLGSMVVIGGTITGLSPVSTTGGMIMAILMAEDQENQEMERHLFLSLVAWGFAALVLVILLALSGVYTLAL